MINRIEHLISRIIKKLRLRSLKNSYIDKTSSIASGSQVINSSMNKHSFCGYDCIIVDTEIGSFCSISDNCEIGRSGHTIDWVSTSPVFNKNKDQIKKKYSLHEFNDNKKTIIGNDVWIGSRCLIKSGVKIGDGAVIGMGSVVTKDIPPYEIWGGNPAKYIKKRFSDHNIQELIKLEWWKLSDYTIEQNAIHIRDINLFIQNLKKSNFEK